jgi:hypothetical protein
MTFLRIHILNESPCLNNKPLLRAESLRRLAWAVWFMDATIDGGNAGFSAIQEDALTIPLPCDERSFLLNLDTPTEVLYHTEPLSAPLVDSHQGSLAIGAYLIRAMAARQVLADVHSRIARRLIEASHVDAIVRQAVLKTEGLLNSLPLDMAYSRSQFFVNRERLPCLISLHVMRNTCQRHVDLLEILAAPYLLNGTVILSAKRHSLIKSALELSAILGDAIDFGVTMDPQMSMHAFNGIEALLFQPLRQTMEMSSISVTRDQVSDALKPLVQVVRHFAKLSQLVALIVSNRVYVADGHSTQKLSTV